MASAVSIGCSWCVDFGYWETTNRGLDPAKMRDVPRWRDSDVYTDLERQVMAYAEAVTATPPAVTDEMVAGLRRHLDDAALVELTMMVAVENVRSRFNSSLGLTSQGFKDRCEIPAAGHVTRSPPSTGTGGCCSPWPTRCSAASPTPRTSSRTPGCAGRRPTGTTSPTRAPTSCRSPPGWRWTGWARRAPAGRATSARGCPSRC